MNRVYHRYSVYWGITGTVLVGACTVSDFCNHSLYHTRYHGVTVFLWCLAQIM